LLLATATTGAGDSSIFAKIFLDDESGFVDELQIESNLIATTWVDGTRAAGTPLVYQPEILQQLAGDITVNFWARIPATVPTAGVYLEAKDTASTNRFVARTAAGNLISFVSRGPGAAEDTLTFGITGDGSWRMVTMVLAEAAAGVDNKLIYLDGRLVASKEVSAFPLWSEINSLTVANGIAGTLLGADGESLMDDLTVLNRAATAAEIRAWYDSGERMDPATAGLPSHEDDRPIMVLTEAATAKKFRLRVVGQTTPMIGVIYMGTALEMMRPIYGGHTPINLARTTVIRPNVSDTGQFLGRSITRKGSRGSWMWKNLTAAWLRKYIDPFIVSALTLPFFVLWRPSSFPGESGYSWTGQDLSAANVGSKDRMTFNLDASGLANE
jgi:hypothetical protein